MTDPRWNDLEVVMVPRVVLRRMRFLVDKAAEDRGSAESLAAAFQMVGTVEGVLAWNDARHRLPKDDPEEPPSFAEAARDVAAEIEERMRGGVKR